MKRIIAVLIFSSSACALRAQQNAESLYQQLRQRINAVQDYTADVKLRIDVAFLNVPLLRGRLYFKAPGKLKLERNGGVSLLPKKSVNLTLNNLMTPKNVTVIDAGTEQIKGVPVHVIKVVPDDPESDVVITRLWVDERRMLVLRTESTTRDNGTVKMELEYGRYEAQSLPDKLTFVLDVNDFKIPKGVTMDYDDGSSAVPKKANGKRRKGRIEIIYLSYAINTGLPDALFAEKK